MEHIVQFAIGIDDEKIINKVYDTAEQQIISDIQRVVMNRLFDTPNYYSSPKRDANPKKDPMSDFAKEVIGEVLLQYKDEIIEKTARYLTDRVASRKAFKDMVNQIVEE